MAIGHGLFKTPDKRGGFEKAMTACRSCIEVPVAPLEDRRYLRQNWRKQPVVSTAQNSSLNSLTIELARLGFRVFEAIFIPCKEEAYDSKGRAIYLDTPSEVQHRRFLDLIKDEMNWQDSVKQDGRCPIPDGKGGVKRCPCRVANPDYVVGSDLPKTLAVKCEGCIFEHFRQEHTIVPFTALDHENDVYIPA